MCCLSRYVSICYGNIANADRVISIIATEAAPIKRMIQNAKDNGMAVDATCGRKTKAVLVMDSGHLLLSALLPETIARKMEDKSE